MLSIATYTAKAPPAHICSLVHGHIMRLPAYECTSPGAGERRVLDFALAGRSPLALPRRLAASGVPALPGLLQWLYALL